MPSLTDLLLSRRQDFHHGIYFIEGDTKDEFLPYASLYQNALHALGGLQEAGIKTGDEVVFQIRDNRDFLILFWACQLGGLIPVPLALGSIDEQRHKVFRVWDKLQSPWLLSSAADLQRLERFAAEHDLRAAFTQLQARWLDGAQVLAHPLPGQVHSPLPTDLAFIQFSSGSTGNPKGVTLSHAGLHLHLGDIAQTCQFGEEERFLSWMPLTHDMGLIGYHLEPLYLGVDQCLLPTSLFIRRPLLWMDKTSQYRATVLGSPNFGYRHFLRQFKPEQAYSWALSCVRMIVNGAEPISAALCQEFLGKLAPWGLRAEVMSPAYGLAEAGLMASLSRHRLETLCCRRDSLNPGDSVRLCDGEKTSGALHFVVAGRPTAYTEIDIRDAAGRSLDAGRVGHIYIHGPNVTSAYYRNPEANQAAYSADGWLNTGDLGFFIDGKLVVTGRAKDIIFFNGINYYAHDLERVAQELDGIELNKVVACGVRGGQAEQDELLLFVLDKKPQAERFTRLAARLSEHLQSRVGIRVSHCLPVAQIPKTTSGKLQRYALAERYLNGEFAEFIAAQRAQSVGRAEPRSPTGLEGSEHILQTLLEGLLEQSAPPPETDWFSLGADSLTLVQLLVAIEEKFAIALTLDELLHYRTIRDLAAYLDSYPAVPPAQSAPATDEAAIAPLSFPQEQLWLISQRAAEQPLYNEPIRVRIPERVNVAALQAALEHLLRHHAVLRTSFHLQNGELQQHISALNEIALAFQHVDLRGLSSESAQARSAQARREAVETLFTLEHAPLWRSVLLSWETHSELCLVAHHLIIDGLSFSQVLLPQLYSLYRAEITEKTAELTEAAPYSAFAAWQRTRLLQDDFSASRAYWLQQLADLPELALPADTALAPKTDFRGATHGFAIPAPVAKKLYRFSRANAVTPFMTCLTAFQALLCRYNGQTDIPVGTVMNLRNQARFSHTVGLFLNTLILRTDLSEEPSFYSALQRVKQVCLDAYRHRDWPFTQLVQALSEQESQVADGLFQVGFVFETLNAPDLGDWDIDFFALHPGTAKFDLTLALEERGEQLRARFEYRSARFAAWRIEAMAQHFLNLLDAMLNAPEQALTRLPLLSAAERQQLTAWSYRTEAFPATDSAYDLFAEMAQRYPEAAALVFGEQRLSYAEVARRVDSLAAQLLRMGAQPGQIIGLCTERCAEMIVAIFAVWRAGCAYLPLDPSHPQERLQLMLDEAEADIILSQSYLLSLLADEVLTQGRYAQLLALDQFDWRADAPQNTAWPPRGPNDLAYVIYTSGSTGTPKGVLVEQQGLCNLIRVLRREIVQPGERVAQFSSFNFDVSLLDLCMSLPNGATLYLGKREDLLPGSPLLRFLQQHRIQLIALTPSTLEGLPVEPLPDLHTIFIGGEPPTAALVERWATPGRRLFNSYGPTETTIAVTYQAMHTEMPLNHIGKPFANVRIELRDAHQQLVPVGVPGEAYIGGAMLARGYLKRPELNTRSFIQQQDGTRLYRSGDLMRWSRDGVLEFIGRIDNQVKIRGFRVELGEIENWLQRHPSVRMCTVQVYDNPRLGKQLIAYIVSSLVAERLPLQTTCHIAPENDAKRLQVAQTEDISSEGVGLCQVPETYRLHDTLHLQLQLPHIADALSLRGEILWRREDRAGVQFKLTRDERRQLYAHVNQLFIDLGFLKMLRRTVAGDLRHYLHEHLPDYMIPGSFIFLRHIPLNNNGKVDRHALPPPDHIEFETQIPQALPGTRFEKMLGDIWQETLGLEKIGIEENFFDWGGNSLLLMKVHQQLEQQLAREVPVTALFQYPNIKTLAAYLEAMDEESKTVEDGHERAQKRKHARKQKRGKQ